VLTQTLCQAPNRYIGGDTERKQSPRKGTGNAAELLVQRLGRAIFHGQRLMSSAADSAGLC
jgi:hypothetical protein